VVAARILILDKLVIVFFLTSVVFCRNCEYTGESILVQKFLGRFHSASIPPLSFSAPFPPFSRLLFLLWQR